MNEYNIYVHVGLPKAASTTLQKHLFEHHDELLNMGVYPVNNLGGDAGVQAEAVDAIYIKDPGVKRFYSCLVNDDELEFEKTDPSRLLDDLLKDHVFDKKQKVVLSDEKITSIFYSHPDVGLKARRLKAAVADAKIIIVLREQLSWIASQYRDHPFDPRHLDIGRPVSIEKWIDIAQWSADVKLFSMLNYNELVQLYENLFGVENVCVLLFEDLVNDLPKFADRLSGFMSMDYDKTLQLLQNKHENTGVSAVFNVYRGIKRKHLTYGLIGQIYDDKFKRFVEAVVRRGNKQNIEISSQYVEKLSLMFSEDNLLLNTRRDLRMERYNYQLKSELQT